VKKAVMLRKPANNHNLEMNLNHAKGKTGCCSPDWLSNTNGIALKCDPWKCSASWTCHVASGMTAGARVSSKEGPNVESSSSVELSHGWDLS
jgi:hypothetical protein